MGAYTTVAPTFQPVSNRMRSAQRAQERLVQFFVVGGHRELPELRHDVGRRTEKDARVGFGQQGGVVLGVAGGHHLVVQLVEGAHRRPLGVWLAQLVADQPVVPDL